MRDNKVLNNILCRKSNSICNVLRINDPLRDAIEEQMMEIK